MTALVSKLSAWLTHARASLLQGVGLLLLRLGAGGMMLAGHGWGKLTSFSERAGDFPDPLGVGSALSMALAVFAECFCAALVVVGAATRLAALPLVVTMLVAAAVVHADDPWAKKEFALIYLVPFLTLAFTGAGPFSLDAVPWRRLTAKREAG